MGFWGGGRGGLLKSLEGYYLEGVMMLFLMYLQYFERESAVSVKSLEMVSLLAVLSAFL